MNAMADKYSAQEVGSIFLYIHEAHPGERYPHLSSMEQKFAHAQDMRDVLGAARPLLLDSLDGACHLAYGGMPNMTWVFNRAGVPLYKADWTDAESVQNALAYLLDVAARRKAGENLTPFRVERLDYRNRDREAFFKVLERAGPKAVREFEEAFGADWAAKR